MPLRLLLAYWRLECVYAYGFYRFCCYNTDQNLFAIDLGVCRELVSVEVDCCKNMTFCIYFLLQYFLTLELKTESRVY